MKSSQRIPGPEESAEHGRARDEKGAAAVEFAIVASLFFMLIDQLVEAAQPSRKLEQAIDCPLWKCLAGASEILADLFGQFPQ